jgi:hypothetical protein
MRHRKHAGLLYQVRSAPAQSWPVSEADLRRNRVEARTALVQLLASGRADAVKSNRPSVSAGGNSDLFNHRDRREFRAFFQEFARFCRRLLPRRVTRVARSLLNDHHHLLDLTGGAFLAFWFGCRRKKRAGLRATSVARLRQQTLALLEDRPTARALACV